MPDPTKYQLTVADYAKYPFLESSKRFTTGLVRAPFKKIISTPIGATALELAKFRVIKSINPKQGVSFGRPHTMDSDLISYVLARAIVSCSKSPSAIERLIECESDQIVKNLESESDPYKKDQILKEIKFNMKVNYIPIFEYIQLVTKLSAKNQMWKLMNRDIKGGKVRVSQEDLRVLLKERIKAIMRQNLPMDVPEDAKSVIVPISNELFKSHMESLQGGEEPQEITKTSYPPCIEVILDTLDKGGNLTHQARFALVTFMNKIGMTEEEIIKLFEKIKDFNMSVTTYQVRHVIGSEGGTQYSPPACATMKTYGLCRAQNNQLCMKVAHPLGYYNAKQKGRRFPQCKKE